MAKERRLIDAIAVLAEMEERQAHLVKVWGSRDHYTRGFEEAVDFVENSPTVDAVEVVRCKDCKYFFDFKCYASNFMRCDPYVPEIHMTGRNDFCSHGKKRGEGK